MRYVIIGAGAVGGTIGARLVQSGRDVVFVARGAHHDVLCSRGLTLLTPDGRDTIDVTVCPTVAAVDWRSDDIAVMATKTQDSLPLLDDLAAVAPPSIAVACAQNGVENERLALRRFESVHAICVMLPASHLEPGMVEAHGTPNSGILDIGRYPAGTDDVDRIVAADLSASRFSSKADPSVMRQKYAKLLMNLGNALEAAAGSTARTGDLYARARAEGVACLEAAGIDFSTEDEDRERRGDLIRLQPVEGRRRSGGSSWQSLARGTGSIEADHLNGEIVLLGRLHGVPTPVNDRLRHVANRMAAEGSAPGSVPIETLDPSAPA